MVRLRPRCHAGKCNFVVEADADVVLQPGVKWEDLNETLAGKGVPLFFPVNLQPYSQCCPTDINLA